MAVSTIDALYNGTSEKLTTSATGITVTGNIANASGDLTLDVASGIILDAGDGTIALHEAGNGVFGTFTRASGSLAIKSEVSDADMIFKGNDGGSTITAMTIDMSAGGNVGIGSPPAYTLHIEKAGNQFIFLNNASTNDGFYFKAGTGASSIQTNGGSNVMNFFTSGNERMKIDSSGAVTMPSQPAFMAVKNAGQLNMPINVYNTVTFGNEVFDRNADYDGSTTFTAPVTGVYQANIKIRIDQIDNQAAYYLVRLQTSNRHYYTITDFDGSTGDLSYSTHSFSQLIDMDAGDTAYIQAYQSGGSVQSDYDNDSGSSQFSMFLAA